MSDGAFSNVRRLATVDSTNTYLLAEARRGAAEGLVVVADHQTAGRGRLGRRWEAPPGTCLLASVLLRPVLPPEQLHLCTAVVALAMADACAQVAGVAPGLKWPNDLVVGEHKVAGVLGESDPGAPGGPPGSVAVVVGVGCNVTWPGPAGAGGTSLEAEAGRPVDRGALLGSLLAVLEERVPALRSDSARADLAEELRRRCVTLGTVVRVELARGVLVGTAVGLTDAGGLVVDTGAGRQVVVAGDVVQLRSSGSAAGAK
jgi:BirA family transcriptional regulator, biotin operon repressor / biotin---[acetyl-CoA-carboxylase] ligase